MAHFRLSYFDRFTPINVYVYKYLHICTFLHVYKVYFTLTKLEQYLTIFMWSPFYLLLHEQLIHVTNFSFHDSQIHLAEFINHFLFLAVTNNVLIFCYNVPKSFDFFASISLTVFSSGIRE